MSVAFDERAILAIERPSVRLMQYYFLCSLLTGPFFPFAIVPYYFRYHTLRYRFDAEGISMRWGILFRREVILNYNRIQDIHLTSNLIERWLGLARVQIQTASGSASAEMTIEGLLEFESVRDFLYSKMRGLKDRKSHDQPVPIQPSHTAESGVTAGLSATPADLAEILKAVSAELRGIRLALEHKSENPPVPPHA